MAVTGRPQEKRSSVSVLQGSAWYGTVSRQFLDRQFLDRQFLDWVRVRVRVRVAVQELTVQELSCSRMAAITMNELQRPTRCTRNCGTDTFTVMSSRIDAYKFSFLPRTVTDWNALPPSKSQAVY